MKLPAGTFTVEVAHEPRNGSPWTVRTWRKRMFGRKRVASDWFLSREEAEAFARRLARELVHGKTADAIRSRKPGWNLF